MPKNREVQASIGELLQEVNKCLERCKTVPGPSADRYDQISGFRSAANGINQKLADMQMLATAQEKSDLTEHQKKVQSKNDESNELQQEQIRDPGKRAEWEQRRNEIQTEIHQLNATQNEL